MSTPVDRAEVWKAWQIFSKGWEHIRKVYQEEVGPIWDFYIHPRHFFGTHAAIAVGSSAPAISNLANNIRPLGDRHGLLVGCINAIGGDASLPPLWTGDVPTQSSQADDASTSTASAPQGQQPYVPVAIDVNQRYSALRLLATHPTYEGHELYPPGSSTKRPPRGSGA
nr:uncharacterized protein CI109_002723 [Kwoniella shandongensis]KAA5528966.1 hypothetical protein CI109_002723 [Kwoniella shandongensis]